MSQDFLTRSLRELYEDTVRNAPADHPDRTAQCLSIPRFAQNRRAGWSAEERRHVSDCRYCQKLLVFEWERTPPGLWSIALFVAGLSPDEQAMQQYFDRNPAAGRLRDSVFVRKLAATIRAVKGLAASWESLPEIAQADWFGFGVLADVRARAAITASGLSVDDKLDKMERWSNAIAISEVEDEGAKQLTVSSPDHALTVTAEPMDNELTLRAISSQTENAGRRAIIEILPENSKPLRFEMQLQVDRTRREASAETKVPLPDPQKQLFRSSLLASWIS